MPDLPSIPLTQSLHAPILERGIAQWLQQATPQRRAALKQSPAPAPAWYQQADAAQRKTLGDSLVASFTAQTRLDKKLADLQDIDTFAAPLLSKALKDQFNVELDVNTTFLRLKKTIEVGILGIDIGSFEVLRLPLLQAALHNFEAAECKADAFHAASGFLAKNAQGHFAAVPTTLTIAQFTMLCRSLDIGAKYQTYLHGYLHPAEGDKALRDTFAEAQKTALRAAAELALLKKDIEPEDYRMILAVIGGDMHPRIGGRPVWFQDLGLMRHRMAGCIVFSICEQYRYSDDLILYIPNEPNQPLKRYTYPQMLAWFKQQFTTRADDDPTDASPSRYQRFFSRFVSYADRPDYFSQFVDEAPAVSPGQGLAPYVALFNELFRGTGPFKIFTDIKEQPPGPPTPKVSNPDPYLVPADILHKGRGLWAANSNLWDHLYEKHRDRLLADARSHAVPSADVDARVRSEKLARLLNIGMLLLNTVSMFVPVLGEVMMGVMAVQLLEETFSGVLEWSEGDRHKAKAHLLDVAENLAFLAVMAGVGKAAGTLLAVKPEPLIESLDPVTLPDGTTRLWKPDLSGYESPVTLPPAVTPTALGQYLHEGKTYIRQGGKLYEKTFDTATRRWRIQHPTDPAAYQPLLSHNGAGAWRHSLERPQTWDRLTLMQRLGPVTERFSDEQLLRIADLSGITDGALRRMHVDNLPPPAPLADALRLAEADADVFQVIEQVSSGRAVDGRYLYALPLVTDLPRWPVGRVLQVFDGPGLSGSSVRYGVERLYHGVKRKPPIRLTRADVLDSQLPAQILAALDETEIVNLLGAEAARVHENRPVELRRQLADHARSRQPALFDSLYQGTQVPDPTVAKLRRLHPGLSDAGARSVLAAADAQSLMRLRETGRVPLAMQEQARWEVQQGRMVRAHAGLHMDTLVSPDSKRLALHTLERLPGWSDQVRLEVRENDIQGVLLDSIGKPDAAQRKYLVKRGPQYQAFNERGETLNSVPTHGDNFYASLMHALPDEARQGLGLPHVGQSLQLRGKIIERAQAQRVESAQIVLGQSRRQPWFKPPQRIAGHVLGYPASGRGRGIAPSLVSRVRDVYPQMTDEQANGFILNQLLAEQTDQQIFNLLQNRQREWNDLCKKLDDWEVVQSADPIIRQYPQLDSRPAMARALKACWRNAPLAGLPGLDRLSLAGNTPLPPLDVSFPHVRALTVRGRQLIEGPVDELLSYFPEVQTLNLIGADTSLNSVPAALEQLPMLKHLSIETSAQLDEPRLARLERLSGLESLQVHSALASPRALEVSALSALRSLRLSGPGQRLFPLQALDLPHLERLDVKYAGIDKLPPELFEPGRARLWSKLSLPWARLGREPFRQAYALISRQPQHWVDLDEMVQEYCWGQLNVHFGGSVATNVEVRGSLNAQFLQRWPTTRERFVAIEALSDEYAELSTRLDAWRPPEDFTRLSMATALRDCWYQGLLLRYGISQPTVLSLSNMLVRDLPELPSVGFEHVTTLHLPNSWVPSAPMGRFIRGFKGLRSLDVSGSRLEELSLLPGEWPVLEHLDLSGNKLKTLDVSSLLQLRALNLRDTPLQRWPTGAEQLPQLSWLDLRNTHITELPPSALANDRMVLDSNFAGAPLSEQAQAELAAARRRVEQRLGLPSETLKGFAEQPVPNSFPPVESGSSIASHLLPAPGTPPTFNEFTRRMNSWIFTRQIRTPTGEIVTSRSRQIAAQRIRACWLEGVAPVETLSELNFHGLVLGDLPPLSTVYAHVDRLNLSGVHLTEQGSNEFLSAFPQVRTLVLSGNPLQAPPQALGAMARLERLELSALSIEDPELWYPTLQRLGQLNWLDMSYCDLTQLRLDGMPHLQTLYLSHNELTHWPEGVLTAPALRRLDLSNNPIEYIPHGALEGAHDTLMAGTDLSNNFNLPPQDLERLQAYSRRTGDRGALGMSNHDIQQLLNDAEEPRTSDSDDDSYGPNLAPVLPDEVLDDVITTEAERWPWFANFTPEEQAIKRVLWDELEREPDRAAFFNLLKLLPSTRDYAAHRALLTHRVWSVIEAAHGNSALREELFAMSRSHDTCADGRILTFSGLEVKVFEYEALKNIDPTDLASKGEVLLDLSRRLFGRGQVETLADRDIRSSSDPAEVRLQYLIGLKEELKLPGVPDTMLFGRPISGRTLDAAAATVRADQRGESFYTDLISREYWRSYLEEKYPQRIDALEQHLAEQYDQLEDAHPTKDDAYKAALVTLGVEREAARTQLLVELSRLETGEPQP